MNKPMTIPQWREWIDETWTECQRQAWRETGMKDWIRQLCPEIAEWQAEIIAEQVRIRIEAEREACLRIVQEMDGPDGVVPTDDLLAAIRARGEK